MAHVLVFDTETTSKNPDREIIEAAYISIEPRGDLFGEGADTIPPWLSTPGQSYLKQDVTEWARRYKPERPISYGAMAIHHIVPEDLEDERPSASFTLPTVDYIIGHSVDFDWEAAGKPNVKRICTHAMAQHVWPSADSHSQSALIYMLRGATDQTRWMLRNAHSALADAQNCLYLLRAILFSKQEITKWSQLWEFSEESRIPLTMPMARWKGILLEDMDESSIYWCLRQDWLDSYLRVGLERVLKKRGGELPW